MGRGPTDHRVDGIARRVSHAAHVGDARRQDDEDRRAYQGALAEPQRKIHIRATYDGRLYALAYPGNWFDARMLETGQYLGLAGEDQDFQPRPEWVVAWAELDPEQRAARARDDADRARLKADEPKS